MEQINHVINSQLICADYNKHYPLLTHGKGAYVYDGKQKPYLDGSGCTAAVSSLGHGNERIAKVLYEQAQKLAIYPSHLFYNQTLENYLKALCDFAPEGFNNAWTISGGTEALENAIKIAFQYHQSKNRPQRHKILARWASYHGNSLTMLDVGGMKPRRDYYTSLMKGHHHLSPCFSYRRPSTMTEKEYEDSLIDELKSYLAQNHDEVICFILEPVVGAALGACPPTQDYLARVWQICQEHDVLLISDEVMTGFGRIGENFAIEKYAQADILACAKGISGGYFPLGAIIVHDKVINTIKATGKPFFSGQTYSCIPLAAAVGLETLNIIQEQKLVQNSKVVGHYLKEKMQTLYEFDFVGDIRGEGLFLGIELVQDKKSKKPFEANQWAAKRWEKLALDNGLVTYACRGTVDLVAGDHLLFAPPLILTKEDVDFLVNALYTSACELKDQLPR